jgi:hypothetical protein
MVLVTGKAVTGSFHITLTFNIQHPHTVDDNVNMNVSGTVMTVRMSADDSLVSGKVSSGKLHAQLLRPVSSQSIFVPVTRIKTENVMVCFDFFFALIFPKPGIDSFTLFTERVRVTVNSLNEKFISWYPASVLIQYGLTGELVMLCGEIIGSCIVV